MKKLMAVLLVVLFASLLNAQDFAKKGVWELGGSLGFSSTTSVFDGETEEDALSTFSVQPYVGYFVINNLELGLIPSFISMAYGDHSQTNFGVYFAPAWNFDLKSNLFPFIEGRIGLNTSSYDDGNPETEENTFSGLAWGFRGGVKVQVGNSALVNLAISYEQITMEPEDWDLGRRGENIFGFNAGFTIFFGR